MLLLFTTLCLNTYVVGQTFIAGWDFQTTSNGGTAIVASPNSPTVFIANVGTGTMYLDGTNASSTWLPTSELNGFGGTALNAGTGFSTATTSPACIALLGGTSFAANGKFVVFRFSMVGLSNLIVSYATQKTATGFSSQIWEYSSNGTDWSAAQTINMIPSSFAVITLNAITGLNNTATAYLRLSGTGASSTSGNNRLDNIQLNASITTDINQASTNSRIYTSNGKVVFSANAGETIEIYNTVGQKLVQSIAVEGENTIPVSAMGVVLVKVGNRFAKVIL